MIKKKITTVLTALIMLLNIFVSVRSYTDTAGRNVNEKVKATFNEFKAYDYDVPTYSVIKPNDGGSFYFDISFTFDSDIKEGDFFTVKYDDKLNITGTLENVYPLSLVTDTGEVIAIGGFDKASNSSVFTFTDYISKHKNVTADMSARAFVEITKVKHTSKNVKFEIDAAGEKKSLTIDVDYSNYYDYSAHPKGNSSVGSLITSNSDVTEKVTYISYINPKGYNPEYSNVFIYSNISKVSSFGIGGIAEYTSDREVDRINSRHIEIKSGVVLNSSDTNLKIYKVPAGENLPESYGLTDEDYNKFEDVTSQFSPKYTHNEQADIDFIQINFDGKMSQKEKYVIKIVTKAVNDKAILFTTEMVTDRSKYYIASSSAEILAFDGWSTGNGTDTTYLEINKVDKETKAVLKGSTFRLYSTEKNEKGELVYNEINSDPIGSEKNGLFFNKLKTGIYYLEEIKAPNGYKKPKDENNKKTVEVKKEDGKLKVYVDGKVLENNKLTVENEKLPEQTVTKEVTFSKTEVNATKELEGASLKVEKLKEDGSVEKEIVSWKSEALAKKITLSEGEYVMTETQAPKGYEVAESITFRITKKSKVEIKNGNDWVEQANSTVKMEDEKTPVIPDEPIEKEVVFSKVNVEGKEIAGAKIQIKDEQGKTIKEWTTKEGESETVKLKEGKYKFYEEKAPEGYLEVTDFEFTVDKDGKIKLGEIKEGETVRTENEKIIVTDKNKPVIPEEPIIPEEPNPNIPDNPNPSNPDKPKKFDNSDSKIPTEPNKDSADKLPKTSVANSVGVFLSIGAVFGAVYAYSKKRR